MAPRKKGIFQWVFWLMVILWRLMCRLSNTMGRVPAIVVGSILVLMGLSFSVTIIGAIIGIPMALAGGFLVVCALLNKRKRRR